MSKTDETKRKTFYVIRELEWTVVVDTANESVANLVALAVREKKSGFTEPGSIRQPEGVRETVDPHILGDSQEYEGTKYWVI
jgi:hypothetical protein